MIQVGDKLRCNATSKGGGPHPVITEGAYYIANYVYQCPRCKVVGIDVGLKFISPYPTGTVCGDDCAELPPQHIADLPLYEESFFDKIEPEYKAVEVDSEISEQARELISLTETIAQ